MAVAGKKLCSFMIESDVFDRLQRISARTGLSKSEQIRQGIRWWLESREWAASAQRPAGLGVGGTTPRRRPTRRPRKLRP
jgi:hypothetical protein